MSLSRELARKLRRLPDLDSGVNQVVADFASAAIRSDHLQHDLDVLLRTSPTQYPAQTAAFHAKQHCWRQLTAVSRSRETRSAGSLVGVPTGLADTRAVVARDESGPRYSTKPLLTRGFRRSGLHPRIGAAADCEVGSGRRLCLLSGLAVFLDEPEVRVLLDHRFESGDNVPGCHHKPISSRSGLFPLPSGHLDAVTAAEVPALTSEPGG